MPPIPYCTQVKTDESLPWNFNSHSHVPVTSANYSMPCLSRSTSSVISWTAKFVTSLGCHSYTLTAHLLIPPLRLSNTLFGMFGILIPPRYQRGGDPGRDIQGFTRSFHVSFIHAQNLPW